MDKRPTNTSPTEMPMCVCVHCQFVGRVLSMCKVLCSTKSSKHSFRENYHPFVVEPKGPGLGAAWVSVHLSMDSTCLSLPPPLLHFDGFHNKLLVKVFRADNTESLCGWRATLVQFRGGLKSGQQQPRATVRGVEWTAPATLLTGHRTGHRRASKPCLTNSIPKWLLQMLPTDLLWTSCLQTISCWERRV